MKYVVQSQEIEIFITQSRTSTMNRSKLFQGTKFLSLANFRESQLLDHNPPSSYKSTTPFFFTLCSSYTLGSRPWTKTFYLQKPAPPPKQNLNTQVIQNTWCLNLSFTIPPEIPNKTETLFCPQHTNKKWVDQEAAPLPPALGFRWGKGGLRMWKADSRLPHTAPLGEQRRHSQTPPTIEESDMK